MRTYAPDSLRVCVVGAGGQLGQELMQASWPSGLSFEALSHRDLDIVDPIAVDHAMNRLAPHIVINAAAYANVDRAESELDLAFAVNAEGARNLARACRRQGAALIHISTDYVFDGRKLEAYREDDPVMPINAYGASKAAGEAAVREELNEYVILRTSWLFGRHGSNFVKTMLRLGAARSELRIVDDQTGCPTSSESLVAAISVVIDRIAMHTAVWGTFHWAGAGPTTWYGFAGAIFSTLAACSRAPSLIPISTAEFPTPARRPANSVLDCRRFSAVYGLQPRPWIEGLDALLEPAAAWSEEGVAA